MRLILAVGDELLFYEPETNTYSRSENDLAESYQGPYPILGLTNFQPGPLVPGYVDVIREDFPLLGRERLLGITVSNYGDAWWKDEEHSFTLEQAGTDGGGEALVVEVTKVEFNLELKSEDFEFTPPQGSREVPPSTTRSISSRETSFPRSLPRPSPHAKIDARP